MKAHELAEHLMKNPEAEVLIEEPWGDQYGGGLDLLTVKRVIVSRGACIYLVKGPEYEETVEQEDFPSDDDRRDQTEPDGNVLPRIAELESKMTRARDDIAHLLTSHRTTTNLQENRLQAIEGTLTAFQRLVETNCDAIKAVGTTLRAISKHSVLFDEDPGGPVPGLPPSTVVYSADGCPGPREVHTRYASGSYTCYCENCRP